ncbi:major coat protein [Marinobacterium arenosum]|uniref:major coat protein n=1 Tax=Marinobacterium arenosum TaxID=2862496 RepID=UPI001C9517F4|nr:major coat protein [Marinobacterium arenosum]MBY4675899.1 hypothetical protein [Marinobacterium arenosum]
MKSVDKKLINNEALKSRFATLLQRSTAARMAVVTMLATAAVDANAALPAAIGTELANVQADGLALADLVWPVVITLFGALVLFKLFKRFGSQI